MMPTNTLRTTGVLIAGLLLTGCASPAAGDDADTQGDAAAVEQAHVEPIEGSDLSLITLEPRAAERLAIETVPVADGGVEAPGGTTVPYSSLIYDAEGGTWVYTNPEPLRFVREEVTVQGIEEDVVVLSDGPAPGTHVVSVGAVELYGAEFGVGH
jgi:hypothetical protein